MVDLFNSCGENFQGDIHKLKKATRIPLLPLSLQNS
jgi:hypothetical protein